MVFHTGWKLANCRKTNTRATFLIRNKANLLQIYFKKLKNLNLGAIKKSFIRHKGCLPHNSISYEIMLTVLENKISAPIKSTSFIQTLLGLSEGNYMQCQT